MREVKGGLINILTTGTWLKGNLKAEGGVRIDGMLEGEITTSDTFVLGKTGIVKGTVKTKDALIGGKIIGNLNSRGKVELKTGSVINGDIICKKLIIEEGATFDGFCKMSEEKPDTERKEVPVGKTEVATKA